ncbi:hypothetical protein K439DRAFT_314737 [Ramaria rubella]|nr:hypothetical protein K439DRAFT_314737 [Ramaria rubella]
MRNSSCEQRDGHVIHYSLQALHDYHTMLKYSGYIMSLEDARKFAVKQGIDVGPSRPAYDAILCNKINVCLRKEKRHNVRAIGMDVAKEGIPIYHILWMTRKRLGPPEISVYEEEPKDTAVKEWLAAEGFSNLDFTTWMNPSMAPRYFIPDIISPEGERLLTY